MQHIDTAALDRAHQHTLRWLGSLAAWAWPATATIAVVAGRVGDLPEDPTYPAESVDLLATACEDGLVAMPSGRFFGFVIGGTLPSALAPTG
jgi:hypothetical protein